MWPTLCSHRTAALVEGTPRKGHEVCHARFYASFHLSSVPGPIFIRRWRTAIGIRWAANPGDPYRHQDLESQSEQAAVGLDATVKGFASAASIPICHADFPI